MKLGIIGLPSSGKTTVFEALTQSAPGAGFKGEGRIATIRVPDPRVDFLSAMYQPRKTIFAQVEYFLPGRSDLARESGRDQSPWIQVRDCDALIHVIRNFSQYGLEAPEPGSALRAVDQELILNDLMVIEKRLERLALDRQRGKKIDSDESALLEACRGHLEGEIPLRRFPEIAAAPALKGFAFLSAKPMLVLFNNAEDDAQAPDLGGQDSGEVCAVIRGKLEHELAQMNETEAAEFLKAFNIRAAAMDRVVQQSYELLGLMSFFTVGDDEVRAWTLRRNTPAVDSAEVIHSDIKKGFIRAEVLAYADLVAAGSYAEARKRGTVRLEGKTYPVQDGDIINFRFNV